MSTRIPESEEYLIQQNERLANALERLLEYAESISGWDYDSNGDEEAIDAAKTVLASRG